VISTGYINNTRNKRKLYGIVGALITLLVPYFLLLNNSNHHLETDQSLCPFKLLTGFPCPGCYHILGPFVIAFAVLTIAVLTTELITHKEYFTRWLYNKKLAYGLGIFLGGYHLIRLVYFVYANSWDSIVHQSIWK
jgi:hypothetical protein